MLFGARANVRRRMTSVTIRVLANRLRLRTVPIGAHNG